MATLSETIWVHDKAELDNTVRNLIARGGQVQTSSDVAVTLFLKKKMNVAVLVVGLLLCLVPGIVYAIWYSTADQSQEITVQIGQPANLGTGGQTHWYDESATDGAAPGTTPPAAPAAPAPPAPPAAEAPAPPPVAEPPAAG